MKTFKHVNAKTTAEACTIMEKYKGQAKLIAGGMDLVGSLKDEIMPDYPQMVVNIKTIPGLDYVREDAGVLKIGALTKLSDIASSDVLKKRYQSLQQAAHAVASPQIRNMATIGGNLCQNVRCWYYRSPNSLGGRVFCLRKGGDTCYAQNGDNRYHAILKGGPCFAVYPSDTAVALTALKAKIVTARPRGGRTIPIGKLYTQTGTILESDEMVKGIEIPKPKEGAQEKFIKFRLRSALDFAIVSVATVLVKEGEVCKEATIALGGVAPVPLRATKAEELIKGKPVNQEIVERVALTALEDAEPLSMNAYKVEIAKTCIKRAFLT
ncbi:MAG: xanthine dehydrogenase family protein subunit M [Syntrophales bacterium]|jgi:xanthine dehydrogenase YagS FAD-binding subunit